jgi:hypothetical protein
LASYGGALKLLGAIGKREIGHWLKQPGREFAPSISTIRAGDASLPVHAKLAEIRCLARLHSQPL